MLIIRRSKLYYTASGIITPVGGRPVHRLREERRERKKKKKKKSTLNMCSGRPPIGVMIPGSVYRIFSNLIRTLFTVSEG